MGLKTPAFTDYETEIEPAAQALRAGHLHDFLALLPAYGGSLVLRSPFVFLPDLWGGGYLALFRSLALPCLAAERGLACTSGPRPRGWAAGAWRRGPRSACARSTR
jgi:hypothetical protein